MIDYYYEFPPDTVLDGQPMRFGFQRGIHPEYSPDNLRYLHNRLYMCATRVWAENANGMTLIRDRGRDVHQRIDRREVTWLKLQARELEA